MPARRLIVIGASSGGIDGLKVLVAKLPAELPAAVCVVMHTSPDSPGVLHDLLQRAGPLRAVSATDGQRLVDGTIYVAPPDRHLLVEPGRLRVTHGPRENRFRPAIDPLFRSAAQVAGPAAIGVILTGNLDDGTAGLAAIKQLGGLTVVQDPDDALFPAMPEHALRHVQVDYVVPLVHIAPLLVTLVASAPDRPPVPAPLPLEIEVNIAKEQGAIDAGIEDIAAPSPYACPECHGVLLQIRNDPILRFRCHTGHAYSADSLLTALRERIEDSLRSSVRALEESALLLAQAARHLDSHGDARSKDFADEARSAHHRAARVRRLIGPVDEGGDRDQDKPAISFSNRS